MTTIELTEEDAAILRELIAERKKEKEHRELMQSFVIKTCRHGVLYSMFCVDCDVDWNINDPRTSHSNP